MLLISNALIAEANDGTLLINIHSHDKFYEYTFNLADRSLYELHRGIGNGKGHGDYGTYSQNYHQKYILKKHEMDNAIKKHKTDFSLFDTAVIQISPDDNFILYVKNIYDKEFTIVDSKDHRVVTKKKTRKINDALWFDGNKGLALLTVSTRTGCGFSELLSAFAGHPIQYNTFYLEIYSLNGDKRYETKITSDILYGSGSLVH